MLVHLVQSTLDETWVVGLSPGCPHRDPFPALAGWEAGRCFLKDKSLLINQGGPGAFSHPHPLPEQNLTARSWAQGLCEDAGRTRPSPSPGGLGKARHLLLLLPPSAPPTTVPRALERVLPLTLQLRAGLGRAVLSLLGGQGGTWVRQGPWRSMSPVNVPAEEVVLHQHVLDALLQGLLLLLHETALLSRLLGTQRGSQGGPHRRRQHSGPPEASATWKHLGEAAPGTDASLPHLPQSPGRQAPPPTSLFAGSSQSWERLNAKQQRTLEGKVWGAVRCWQGAQPTPGWAAGPRASSPQLALDLDPAGAAQEGPGLVPLLHGRQAGAEHLQPQVQHLLAGGRGDLLRGLRPGPLTTSCG